MGGKKQLGHKWQWRRAVILIEAKLRYWDAKVRPDGKPSKEAGKRAGFDGGRLQRDGPNRRSGEPRLRLVPGDPSAHSSK